MIAIINYQAGNLKSLSNALVRQGFEVQVTNNPEVLLSANLAIIPGVGAFSDAMDALKASGLYEPLRQRHFCGKPILGICLGMQLFFEGSEEGAEISPSLAYSPAGATQSNLIPGLGFMSGNIRRLKPNDKALKVPHMGWNQLTAMVPPLCSRENQHGPDLRTYNGMNAYFVHSYGLTEAAPEHICFTADHGQAIPALVYKPLDRQSICGALLGFQFHPEKSGPLGEKLLADAVKFLIVPESAS